MDNETNILKQSLKFLTGDSERICRLCFASTENEEYRLEDTAKILNPHINETISYSDLFLELGVSAESSLPQGVCHHCANTAIKSYAFMKQCQYSNHKWNEVLERITKNIDQSASLRPNTSTIYIVLKGNDNLMLTSRKTKNVKSKRIALGKIKEILSSRNTYEKKKKISKRLICKLCGEKCTSKKRLLKHLKLHGDVKYSCPQCLKQFPSQLQTEEHIERVHLEKNIPCPKCAKMFSTERMLKYHDKQHHEAALCKLCFVQFPSKALLRVHMDKHDICKCSHCGKSFVNRASYKSHLKICGKNDTQKFFCDHCDKTYRRKNGIRTHLKIDHGFGKVYICNWCGKKYDAISRLKCHVVKHTKEKNFHCEQCGGKFVTQAALVYHTRLHTGERPFLCDQCDESFLSASRRMEHKRRKHSGPTKECTYCHAKFFTGHNLKIHVQRHFNPHSKLYASETVEIGSYTSKLQNFPLE